MAKKWFWWPWSKNRTEGQKIADSIAWGDLAPGVLIIVVILVFVIFKAFTS